MSILESFYVLFKSDASDYKKGAADVKRTNKELEDNFNQTRIQAVKAFGQQVIPEVNKLSSGLLVAARNVGALIGGLFTLSSVYKHLAETQEKITPLGRKASLVGVNPGQIQAFQEAAIREGGSAESALQGLEQLSERFAGSMQLTLAALPQLADGLQTIDKRLGRIQAINAAHNLGIYDEATILLLLKGGDALKVIIKQSEKYGVITEEQIKINSEFVKSQADVNQSLESLYRGILQDIQPAWTKINHAIAETIKLYFFLKKSVKNEPLFGKKTGHLKTTLETVPDNLIENNQTEREKEAAQLRNWFANLFGFGDAKKAISEYSSYHIPTAIANQLSTTTIANRKSNSFNTGPITVNTNVTDAYGFAEAVKSELKRQFDQSNSNFDDGVFA